MGQIGQSPALPPAFGMNLMPTSKFKKYGTPPDLSPIWSSVLGGAGAPGNPSASVLGSKA